jgi:hypothetical protein
MDEYDLRQGFFNANRAHDKLTFLIKMSAIPIGFANAYILSKYVKPIGVGMFGLAYYGFYKYGALGWADNTF